MTAPTPATPESLAEANRTLPRKLVAADVLLRDEQGRVLIVDPAYKAGWDLPGGMVGANEPPDEAARRELREELGLDVRLLGMLIVEWVPPHGPWDDEIYWLFNGGVLDAGQVAALRLADGELAAAEFVEPEEAAGRLGVRLQARLAAALGAAGDGRPRYLHDGEELRTALPQ